MNCIIKQDQNSQSDGQERRRSKEGAEWSHRSCRCFGVHDGRAAAALEPWTQTQLQIWHCSRLDLLCALSWLWTQKSGMIFQRHSGWQLRQCTHGNQRVTHCGVQKIQQTPHKGNSTMLTLKPLSVEKIWDGKDCLTLKLSLSSGMVNEIVPQQRLTTFQIHVSVISAVKGEWSKNWISIALWCSSLECSCRSAQNSQQKHHLPNPKSLFISHHTQQHFDRKAFDHKKSTLNSRDCVPVPFSQPLTGNRALTTKCELRQCSVSIYMLTGLVEIVHIKKKRNRTHKCFKRSTRRISKFHCPSGRNSLQTKNILRKMRVENEGRRFCAWNP